jgi:hypothetical protein
MREIRLSGSVEGVVSNHDPYSDFASGVACENVRSHVPKCLDFGKCLVGEISSERARHLHFYGYFAFTHVWSGIFDSNSISTRDHSPAAFSRQA